MVVRLFLLTVVLLAAFVPAPAAQQPEALSFLDEPLAPPALPNEARE
jgi:hypothetical protein